jgi:hypothetical protein
MRSAELRTILRSYSALRIPNSAFAMRFELRGLRMRMRLKRSLVIFFHSAFRIRHSAFSTASVPQQLQDEFCKLVFVGASPTRGPNKMTSAECGVRNRTSQIRRVRVSGFRTPQSPLRIWTGDHDVTAASRPVKAFVPVRIRLVTPISMGHATRPSDFAEVGNKSASAICGLIFPGQPYSRCL